MTTVQQVYEVMQRLAPPELAEHWDNPGLLVDCGGEVRRVLVTLDITPEVVAEAAAKQCTVIVAHHPVIFDPLKRLCPADVPYQLVRAGISAICMHTNLDAAEGGVNDVLAEKLGLLNTQPLTEEKIGRVGTLKCELPLVDFTRFVVKLLGCNGLRFTDCGKAVHRVAVGGGACGDYIGQAIALGCDTFVTSDLSYHEFLDTKALNLIDAGHFPTENVICPVIAERLQAAFPHLSVALSAAHDREIIQYCIKKEK